MCIFELTAVCCDFTNEILRIANFCSWLKTTTTFLLSVFAVGFFFLRVVTEKKSKTRKRFGFYLRFVFLAMKATKNEQKICVLCRSLSLSLGCCER